MTGPQTSLPRDRQYFAGSVPDAGRARFRLAIIRPCRLGPVTPEQGGYYCAAPDRDSIQGLESLPQSHRGRSPSAVDTDTDAGVPVDIVARIFELRNEGLSFQEERQALGIAAWTVSRYVRSFDEGDR